MLFLALISSLLPLAASANGITVTFSENIPKEVQDNAQLMIQQKIIIRDNLSSSYRLQQISNNIASMIATAAQPYGYFSTQCQVSHDGTQTARHFTANCKMGQPVKVKQTTISVSGPGKTAIESLIQNQKNMIKPGSRFQSEQYEKVKNHLLEIAHHDGYVDASTTRSKLIIDTESYSAVADIKLDSGPIYHFGRIDIEQQTYNPEFLRALAPYQPSSVFNNNHIAEYKNTLESTNLFSYVSVLPFAPDNQNKTIPTQVFYEPVPQLQYGLGVGYSSYANLFYSATIQRNRLTETGARSVTELLNSEKYAYAITTLSIPKTHPTHDYFNIQVSYKKQRIDYVGTDHSLTTTLAYIVQRQLSPQTTLRRETAINYSVDRSTFDNDTSNNVSFLYPSIKYDWLFHIPEQQSRFVIKSDLSGNIKALMAPTNFAKIIIQERYNRWFNEQKFIIQLRGKQGYITTSNDGESLPLGWYFYTGGAYSVRGFAYNSIGANPNTSDDNNRYLYTASVELQQLVTKDIYAIAFIDCGDAMEQLSRTRPSYAIGSGIVWKTFAGNLEISIAKPIKNYSGDRSMESRLNISIHQPFTK